MKALFLDTTYTTQSTLAACAMWRLSVSGWRVLLALSAIGVCATKKKSEKRYFLIILFLYVLLLCVKEKVHVLD